MANRYWVSNGGSWTDTAHWSASSGGGSGASVPTSSDDAIFDGNSFPAGPGSYIITMPTDDSATCNNFSFVNTYPTMNYTFTLNGGDLNVYGNLSLAQALSHNGYQYVMKATTPKTITQNLSSSYTLTINGVGGTFTLQDNWIGGGSSRLSLIAGTFDTNNKTVTHTGILDNITITGTDAKTLNLGSTVWTTRSYSYTGSNLTLNAGTSTLKVSNNFTGGGMTYNNVEVYQTASLNQNNNGTATYSGDNTFANLTLRYHYTGSTDEQFVLSGNQTVTGTFTATGLNNGTRIFLRSNTVGTQRTITAGSISISNVEFRDINAAGAGAPFTGTFLGNVGNNSNITFTTATTRYWVGNGGNWNNTARWSATSGGAGGQSAPLSQDSVIFNASSFSSGSQTITACVGVLGGSIDFTGVTNNPALSLTRSGIMQGNLTLVSGMTSTSGTSSLTLVGSGSYTLNTAGITIGHPVTITATGGTVTLGSNLVLLSSRTLSLTGGTLNANNYNVTVGLFSSVTGTRSITMGAGTWTLTGTGSVWNTFSSLGVTANTSTVIINDTSVTSKTFWGSGKTYYILTVTGDNVAVRDSSTFTTLNVNNAGHPTGLKFGSGNTQTVTNFSTNGSVGSLAKILSTTASSRATLSKASGSIQESYMDIKDSTATGGASWFAGSTSTNSGNNTGWVFSDPMEASVSGVATNTASILATLAVAGSATGEASVSAPMSGTYALAGSISGVASVNGSVDAVLLYVALTGTATVADAILGIIQLISASISASASASASQPTRLARKPDWAGGTAETGDWTPATTPASSNWGGSAPSVDDWNKLNPVDGGGYG